MYMYWLVLKLAVLDLLEYKFDFIMTSFKYAFTLLMSAMVWMAVAQEQPSLPLNQEHLLRYFLVAALLYTFSNFHTDYVESDIKMGQISKYLLKPLSAPVYYFTFQLGRVLMDTAIKAAVIVPVLLVTGQGSWWNWQNVLICLAFVPCIYIFAFNQFMLISELTFWLDEAYSLRWAWTITTRFLSGLFVPLSFFPGWWQTVSFWLPFQHLAYTPIEVISGRVTLPHALWSLAILASWAVMVSVLRHVIWKWGLYSYESVAV